MSFAHVLCCPINISILLNLLCCWTCHLHMFCAVLSASAFFRIFCAAEVCTCFVCCSLKLSVLLNLLCCWILVHVLCCPIDIGILLNLFCCWTFAHILCAVLSNCRHSFEPYVLLNICTCLIMIYQHSFEPSVLLNICICFVVAYQSFSVFRFCAFFLIV